MAGLKKKASQASRKVKQVKIEVLGKHGPHAHQAPLRWMPSF